MQSDRRLFLAKTCCRTTEQLPSAVHARGHGYSLLVGLCTHKQIYKQTWTSEVDASRKRVSSSCAAARLRLKAQTLCQPPGHRIAHMTGPMKQACNRKSPSYLPFLDRLCTRPLFGKRRIRARRCSLVGRHFDRTSSARTLGRQRRQRWRHFCCGII